MRLDTSVSYKQKKEENCFKKRGYLYKSRSSELVLLCSKDENTSETSEDEFAGIVVIPDDHNRAIGEYYSQWVASRFEPFEGEITLKQTL
jgi:hypothetical protein